MNCLLKNIPPENLIAPYDGNRGIGFPLQSICEVLPQPDTPPPPIPEECYLAVELSTVGFSLSDFQLDEIYGGYDKIVFEETVLDDPAYLPPLSTADSQYSTLTGEALYFSAPCVVDFPDICFLAREEDGFTNFEREENLDYFEVECP